ncbi:MAG: hypothetical protein WCG08_08795 [Paludibacter sp.]|jgi:hypothetical protein
MKRTNFIITLIIALVYWIPSTIALLDTINGSGMIFPGWLDFILMPGYILGFALCYGGGAIGAIIGQFIELIIVFFISRMIYEPFRRKISKDDEE